MAAPVNRYAWKQSSLVHCSTDHIIHTFTRGGQGQQQRYKILGTQAKRKKLTIRSNARTPVYTVPMSMCARLFILLNDEKKKTRVGEQLDID